MPTEEKSMSNEVDVRDDNKIISAITEGAADKLSVKERAQYLVSLCESLGLNPLSSPFEWTRLNGKLVPYAKKNATDQLRKIHRINCNVVERRIDKELGLISVSVRVSTPDGRDDEDIGVVALPNKGGDVMANALMKAVTKAKRRATLSIAGLSMIDETELETIGSVVMDRMRAETATESNKKELEFEPVASIPAADIKPVKIQTKKRDQLDKYEPFPQRKREEEPKPEPKEEPKEEPKPKAKAKPKPKARKAAPAPSAPKGAMAK